MTFNKNTRPEIKITSSPESIQRRNNRLPRKRQFAVLVMLVTAIALAPAGLAPNLQAANLQDEAAALNMAQTASVAQNNGEYVFAAEQWEKLLNQHADSSLAGKAHYNAGICYLQSNQFEKAIAHFKSSLPKLENDQAVQKPQANLYLGFAQFRRGQQLKQESKSEEANQLLTTATQTFANLLKEYADFADADQVCYFQGGAFEELGQRENALASYTKMLDYPKQTFKLEGLYATADVHDQLGQYATALEYFEKVLTEAKAESSPLLDEIQGRTGSTLIRLATADENGGNKDAAIVKLNRAQSLLSDLVEQDPSSKDAGFAKIAEDARYELAFCSRRLGQFESAARLFEAVAANPQSPLAAESLANAGRNYIDAGKPDLAKTVLEKVIATDPKNATLAAHWLAGVYLKSNEPQTAYDVATRQLEKSINETPKDAVWVALLMDQADAAFEIPAKRKESIDLFNTIAEQYPDHPLAPSALHSSAFTSLDINDFKTAIETATRFETKYADSDFLADTLEVKAESYLLNDQPAEAAKVFESLISRFLDHKHRTRWQIREGLATYMNKDYDSTIAKLNPLLDSVADDGDAYSEAMFWIGSSQFQLKEFSAAAQSLSDSYARNNQWKRTEETLVTLCRSQLASDQTDAANKTAENLVNGFPESPLLSDLHYYLGEHAYDADKFEDALKHFDLINEKYSNSKFAPYSLYNAAYCQLELKNYKESDALFSTLINTFPGHELAQRAKIGRGASRRKTGNVEASITDLKEYLSSDPQGESRTNALYELGLAQIDVKNWSDAVATFKTLIAESAESPRIDRYFYELAWAYRSLNQEDLAMEFFTKIATDKPESPLAAEANFHVGSAAYNQDDFDKAIAAYRLCVDSKTEDSIREKAAYKLAWAHYKQDQFQQAHDGFANQVKLFPDGELFADGMFMVAESQYRLKNYAEAFQAYTAAKPIVDAANQIDSKIKWLTMLHGAQSANKLKKYNEAIELARGFEESDADISFKQDAWLEMGTAYGGLNQPEPALEYYRKAAENLGKTGARAHCMIGDTYFKNKQFDDAVNEFKLVYFGFGGPQAADDVKPWQAYAIYEAARCNFVQVEGAPADQKPKLVGEAIRQFEYLLENYNDDRLAPEARKQLETLKKIDGN